MQSRLLTFTNARGESITFRNNSPFFISDVEGLGNVDADIQTQQSPYQDGTNYIDSVLNPRAISFQVNILGRNDTDISHKRAKLSSLFNPKLGPGTLEYRYGDIVRLIKAIPEHVPSFPTGFQNRGRRHQVGIVDLICPNPYWRSSEVTGEPAFEPLFEFPFDDEFEMGTQRDVRVVENDGDAPAPIRVDFYGPAQSPIIKNMTTGEFIKINRFLEENEVLKIDTSDDKKSVIYVDSEGNEMNVFHWLDLDSTFFKLELGENEISCLCAISNNQRDFEIYYSKHYTAV